jgi:hypothetical protein
MVMSPSIKFEHEHLSMVEGSTRVELEGAESGIRLQCSQQPGSASETLTWCQWLSMKVRNPGRVVSGGSWNCIIKSSRRQESRPTVFENPVMAGRLSRFFQLWSG